jgi:hypothetical protein
MPTTGKTCLAGGAGFSLISRLAGSLDLAVLVGLACFFIEDS